MLKNPPANAGDLKDMGLIPGSGRSPGGARGNPLQYSCLENPMDRGAWQAVVHRVTKSWILLKQLSTQRCVCTHTHTRVYIYIKWTHMHTHYISFIHSSFDGHSGCFHVLATLFYTF